MIEDHVMSVGDAHGVRAGSAIDAFTHPDEAADVVVRTREGKSIAIDCHAVAGRGLASDGDVGLGRKTTAGIIEHATDFENDGPTGNTTGIAKRARAGVICRRDEIDRSLRPPVAKRPKPCARKAGSCAKLLVVANAIEKEPGRDNGWVCDSCDNVTYAVIIPTSWQVFIPLFCKSH